MNLQKATKILLSYGYVLLSGNAEQTEWHFLKGETQLHLFHDEQWIAQFVRWNGLHRKASVEFVFPSPSFETYEKTVLP